MRLVDQVVQVCLQQPHNESFFVDGQRNRKWSGLQVCNDVEAIGCFVEQTLGHAKKRTRPFQVGVLFDKTVPEVTIISLGIMLTSQNVEICYAPKSGDDGKQYDLIFMQMAEIVVFAGKQRLRYEDIVGKTSRPKLLEKRGSFTFRQDPRHVITEEMVSKYILEGDLRSLVSSAGGKNPVLIDVGVFDGVITTMSSILFYHGEKKPQVQLHFNCSSNLEDDCNKDAVIFTTPSLLHQLRKKASIPPFSRIICVPGYTMMDLVIRMETEWVWNDQQERVSVVLPFTYWVFHQRATKPAILPINPDLVSIGPLNSRGFSEEQQQSVAAGKTPLEFGEIILMNKLQTGVSGWLLEGKQVCIAPYYPCHVQNHSIQIPNEKREITFDANVVEKMLRNTFQQDIVDIYVLRNVPFLRVMVVLAESMMEQEELQIIQKWRQNIPSSVVSEFLEIQIVERIPSDFMLRQWACRALSYRQLGTIPTLSSLLQEGQVSNANKFNVEFTETEEERFFGDKDKKTHLAEEEEEEEEVPPPPPLLSSTTQAQQEAEEQILAIIDHEQKQQEGRMHQLVRENVYLQNRVMKLETEACENEKELKLVMEHRQVLTHQLEKARCDAKDHFVMQVKLDHMNQQLQTKLEQANLKIEKIQKERVREHEKYAKILMISSNLENADMHNHPHISDELSLLLQSAEFELEQTQKQNQQYLTDIQRQQAQLQVLRQRVDELQRKNKVLELENRVAVDFLVRLDMTNTGPTGNMCTVSSSSSSSSLSHEGGENNKDNIVLIQDSDSSSMITRDPEMVKQQLDALEHVFQENGIAFPVTMENFEERQYFVKAMDKIVTLAVTRQGTLVIENHGNKNFTDLVDELKNE